MSGQSMQSTNWRRTRRNVLAFGGVLAGAALSRISRALADDNEGRRPRGDDGRRRLDGNDSRHSDGDSRHRWDNDGSRHGDDGGRGHNDGPPCYLRQTHILTAQGERKIEDLRIGDFVITVAGQAKPIEWIGRRRYPRRPSQKWPVAIMPVRVARGALAQDVPHADLCLSQEHCLLIDGGLIRVGDLLNGTSIALDPCIGLAEIDYFHIKLADHDAIFAEGAASETLLFNAISVGRIDNVIEYERAYGPPDIAERPCASAYILSGSRARLSSHLRSAFSPWLDRRNHFDRVRDRLWDRAEALAV
jgi:hypothetical protein